MKLLFNSLIILGLCGLLQGCNSDDVSGNTTREALHIAVAGTPNGLWWDANTQVLYISDDANNLLMRWTDSKGFIDALNLPTVDPKVGGLGQVVVLNDQQIFVTRFGYGTAGTVLQASAVGSSQAIQGIDPKLRRIGLTADSQGQLYDCGFVKNSDNTRTSTVNLLSIVANSTPLTAQELEVISGTGKLVGCVIGGSTMYLSDQDNNQILSVPLSQLVTRQSLQNLNVFAKINQPDLLAAADDGSLFTGGTGGIVYRITATGQVSEFSKGYRSVRGVAYDAANKRLFVIDRNTDTSAGAAAHLLHVLPVN
ncbi:MAG: hypothetical protein PHP00_14620 [Thiotrichaceae bacterium]|nr:hypothetical protein [Thiotrichaceae bacterium]